MDTFIRIICIYRDGCEDDAEPNTEEVSCTIRHVNKEAVYNAVDKAMMDIIRMNGVLVPKNKLAIGKQGDVNDLKFIPMHMFARFEFKTKTLIGETPGPVHDIGPNGVTTTGGYEPGAVN